VNFAFGACTDVGRGRSANEDAFVADADSGLYAVADGMGGHRAGEVASATAIETLRSAFGSRPRIADAVEAANAAVFAQAGQNPEMRGMGTTVTAVALTEGRYATIGHVGDSRAYLLRDGGLTQVTEDHSLVEQLVREGQLSPEEAANHPQRAIITRALGIEPDVEVDVYEVDLRSGDRLLLCSDGLSNMVRDQQIELMLREQPDPQQAAEMLVEAANAAGGDDNITVVIVDALGDAGAGTAAAAAPVAVGTPRPEGGPPPTGGVRPGRRRRAMQVLVWALPIVLVLGSAFLVVGWYARRTFYVGLAGDRVALYRGVPGGILGWDPTLEQRSDLRTDDLTAKQRNDLEEGERFSNRGEAARFLDRLEDDSAQVRATETTEVTEPEGGIIEDDPVVSTTTTTVAPP
jgi:PPM family protein phosphatase